MTKRFGLPLCLLVFFAGYGTCQDLAKDIKDKIDALTAQTYQTAMADFPCKIKGRGKPSMLRWEEVDRCLNQAAAKVDWDSLSKELGNLRSERRLSQSELFSAVQASFAARAFPFEKVFNVKKENVSLPLTNSLLRFVVSEAFQDLPVFTKEGTKLGTFSGIYSFERTGALAAANTYKLSVFQFVNLKGENQPVSDKLLLDSYGVPWSEAKSRPGFRLPLEKLSFGR